MPDLKRIRVYYEGDDDKVVLTGLKNLTLLPAGWEIAQRDKQRSGKDGLVYELAVFVRPVNGVGGSAVALVDLDDLDLGGLKAWFRNQLTGAIRGTDPPLELAERESDTRRLMCFTVSGGGHSGQVVLVPVGTAEDQELRAAYGIDKFAVDDHVLRLVREERVYVTVSELEGVPHDVAMRKLVEVADLFRKNGIAVRQTKRLLHILRAVTAVRPSSAVFIERLMKKAGEALTESDLRRIFSPLVSDLEEAARLLAL